MRWLSRLLIEVLMPWPASSARCSFLTRFRAVPELIELEGIHKEAEAVESALVQDGGSDGLFEGFARSIDWFG